MKRVFSVLMAALSLMVVASHAHEATERYIPIGKSPGVSTQIGDIREVDESEHILTVTGSAGAFSVKVTGQTRIYLDRSGLRQTSLEGSFADCRPGRKVEIRFADESSRDTAAWIKIEVTR